MTELSEKNTQLQNEMELVKGELLDLQIIFENENKNKNKNSNDNNSNSNMNDEIFNDKNKMKNQNLMKCQRLHRIVVLTLNKLKKGNKKKHNEHFSTQNRTTKVKPNQREKFQGLFDSEGDKDDETLTNALYSPRNLNNKKQTQNSNDNTMTNYKKNQ